MDGALFTFFKKSLLVVIAVAIVLFGIVGLVAIFTVNSAASNGAAYPSSTVNIYKGTMPSQSQQATSTYPTTSGNTPPVVSEQQTYTKESGKNINVQTTVNVRSSGYTYYPRNYGYSRYYRPYRYYYPVPYGYKYRYRPYPYFGYGYNAIYWGRY